MGAGFLSEGTQEAVEGAGTRAAIESAISGDNFTGELFEQLITDEARRDFLVGGLTGGIISGGVGRALQRVQAGQVDSDIEKAGKNLNDLVNFTPKDLTDVNKTIENFDKELEFLPDGEIKTGFVQERQKLVDLKSTIESDLDRQGQSLPSQAEAGVNANLEGLQSELSQIESEISGLEDGSPDLESLQGRQQELLTQIDESQNAITGIDEELQDSDLDEDIETELVEERAFFSNRVSEAQRELTSSEVDPVARLDELNTQAENTRSQIQELESQEAPIEIFEAGDSRVVADTSIPQDTRDFAGSILSGFNITRPVVLSSAESARNRDFQGLLLEEGVRGATANRSGGRAVPTAFTVAQGRENDIIVLPETELTPRNAEAISHEVGHVVGEDLLAKNPQLRAQLESEFNSLRSNNSVAQRGADQKLPQRLDDDRGQTSSNQVSFREFIADNTARFIQNKNLETNSPVQRFFKDLADSLRDIYNRLTGNESLAVNTTLDAFLEDHFNQDRFAAFLENRRGDSNSSPSANTNSNVSPESQESVESDIEVPTRTGGRFKFDDNTIEIDNKVLEQALEEEGLSEETLNDSDNTINEFREEFQQFLRGDATPEIKQAKTFETILGGKLLSPEAKANIANNLDSSFEKQARESTVNEVRNFINVFGIEDSTDAFFNEQGADPDFRLALGSELSSIYDRLAIRANRLGDQGIAKRARGVQLGIADNLIKQARAAARTLDLVKLLKDTSTPAGVQHLIESFLDNIAEDLNVSKHSLSDHTRDRIKGLSEELLEAKRNDLDALANTIGVDIKTQVTNDLHRSNVSDVLAQTWYASTLSSIDTIITLPGVSVLTNFITKTLPTAVFDTSTRNAVRGALKDVSQGTIPTLKSSLKDGKTKDVERLGTQKAGEDVSANSKAIFNRLKDKENKTLQDRIALGLSAVGVGASVAGEQVFRVFNTIDDVSQLGVRQLHIRALTEDAIKKDRPNLTGEDLRNEVSRQLYGTITKDGVTRDKEFNDFRDEAREAITKGLSDKRASDISDGDLESLITRETFIRMNRQVDADIFAQANRLGEEVSLLQDVEGLILGNASTAIQRTVAKLNNDANSIDSDIGRELARFGVFATKVALFPFNKPVVNFVDKSLNYIPVIGQLKNANRALGRGEIKGKSVLGNSDFELTAADIIEARTAVIAPATLGAVFAAKIISEFDLDDEEKTFDITGPEFNKNSTSAEARPSGSVKAFGRWVNYQDSILSGYFSTIGAALDAARNGKIKVKPSDIGLLPSEAKKQGLTSDNGLIKLSNLSKSAQKDYINNHKIELLIRGISGSIAQAFTASPLGQVSFLNQVFGPFSNENTAAKAAGRTVGKFVSPGIGDDLAAIFGVPKISKAPKFELGSNLLKGAFTVNDSQALAQLIGNSPIAGALENFPARNILGEEIKRDIPLVGRLVSGKVSKEIQWLANNGITHSDNSSINIMRVSLGGKKRNKANQDAIVDSRSQMLDKIGAAASNIFSPEEADTLQKDFMGPNIKKLIQRYMKEETLSQSRADTIKSFDNDLSNIRRLSKQQFLNDKYAKGLGLNIFNEEDQKDLNKLLGN